MTTPPKILLIYTGGTIGMVKDYTTNALKAFDFSQISEKIPELAQLDCKITALSFETLIDSSNMNIANYVQLTGMIEENYDAYDGFVVLSGSDTMSYVSSAISFMFENLQKPVVFTGSQLPIGHLRTDAKENLITSIEIAAARKNNAPIITEVCLYFEYKLYRANRTTKINAEQFEAFTSLNYPSLAESGVHLTFNHSLLLPPVVEQTPLIVRKQLNSHVVILKLFPGIRPEVVASILAIPSLKGVVLETYGAGNALTDAWFVELLETAINKGIYIVNVTQCAGGSVLMGHYETSLGLKKIGVVNGKDMTTESALAKMMYLLGEQLDKTTFKAIFETSLRGEVS